MKTTNKSVHTLCGTDLPSKSTWSIYLIVIFLLVVLWQSCVVAAKCSHLEIDVCTEDFKDCQCIPCKKCRVGYGLVPQCGSRVVMQFPQCIKCKQGKTYSKEFNMESCNPCPICYGTKTLKSCSISQPTKCSQECQDGYERNPTTEMCEPVLLPTKSTSTAQSSATELQDKRAVLDLQEFTTTKRSISTQDNLKPARSGSTGTTTKQFNTTVKIICSILGLLSGTAVVWIIYKKRRLISRLVTVCCRQSMHFGTEDEEMPLYEIVPEDTLLSKISPHLRDKIAVKISKKGRGVRGWQDIGHEYKIDKDDIDAMDYHDETTNPGQLLLQKLHTLRPQETVRKFMQVLHKLKRQDVINIIHKEYSDNENTQ